ncbi:hypothetical protein AVEN_95936-1 [Araneus ventricosus]|uniref:Uncharacterized protein n=1 Tax=Araneus ventricosus TaxID=182803 RepID=A0A4Y2G3R8_ARAVE|nr:hypothetical protein AVEN_95936-1 [Araneus ventricosus]
MQNSNEPMEVFRSILFQAILLPPVLTEDEAQKEIRRHPRSARRPEMKDRVLDRIVAIPSISVRALGHDIGVFHSTVNYFIWGNHAQLPRFSF